MFTGDFFEELLNLDEQWQVEQVSVDHQAEEITILITYNAEEALCGDSHEYYRIYDHAPLRRWRHLDTMQYKTYLSCRLPRVKNSAGKVVTIAAPWASKYERYTHLFEHAAIDLLKATKNQTKTAELLRCGFNVINRIMHRSTQRGLARRDLAGRVFKHLSVDEKSFRKGHSYVSVLSDPERGCVLDIAEGRTKTAVQGLLGECLSARQAQQVETISMDMWKAYMSMAQQKLPQAALVHDRFHLVKYLNEAIDKVRRREVKTQDQLIHSRYVLLKNKANLTEKQRIKFDAIQKANYQVSKAWQVRENFTGLFGKETRKEHGLLLFYQWAEQAICQGIKEVTKVVERFKRHSTGVINALVYSASNAMAERLNGKIQEVKSTARGYRTFDNFRSAVLFFHGDLQLYPLNSW